MPSLPASPPRDFTLRARVRAVELERIRVAAAARDLSVSHLVRRAALEVAERILAGGRVP